MSEESTSAYPAPYPCPSWSLFYSTADETLDP